MLAEIVNRALAWLQGKAFGHQKMALESTVPPENSERPRVEVILPDEPQRSMGLRTLLESGEPNSL
jgi:hypothetical protein